MMKANKPEYLYIHVPFCHSICSYCDFAHIVYQENYVEKWLKAISEEIENTQINTQLKTIYVGGGTPTSLTSDQLERFLVLLDPYSRYIQEYTIEINPETLDKDKVDILVKHGINRVSIGLESSDDALLKLMNRMHTYEEVKKCVLLLKKKGITNISLDIMYSLPTQTMFMLEKTIDDAILLEPTHLSLYSLTIEENTMFAKKRYDHLDDDIEADMYEFIQKKCEENGYQQYEVSNFCKPGFESIHNSAYWNYRDFYGIGCGASGKEDHHRYDKTKILKEYLQQPLLRKDIPLSKEDEMFEMVMMGMRFKKGMNLKLFEDSFKTSFLSVYGDKIETLLNRGLVEITNTSFRCSDKGYEIMNEILEEIL